MNQFVQGDILFERVEEGIPTDARPVTDGVVARGEATGHVHRVLGEATVFEVAADRLLVEVVGTAEVVHEEHATVTFPKPGVWRAVRQHTLEADEIRRMMD